MKKAALFACFSLLAYISYADAKYDCVWDNFKPKPEYFPAKVIGMDSFGPQGGIFCCGMKGNPGGVFGDWEVQFTNSERASYRVTASIVAISVQGFRCSKGSGAIPCMMILMRSRDEKLNAQRCMLVPEQQDSLMPEIEMKFCPGSITLENRNIRVAPSPPERWYEDGARCF